MAFSRKEQLVILERCLQLLEEAVDDHVTLNSHVWNSVIYVAACTKQLQRAFQLLDQMQSAGVSTDEHTYGSLIEACVLAKEPELAQRLFNNAMREVGGVVCCWGAAEGLHRGWCRQCCNSRAAGDAGWSKGTCIQLPAQALRSESNMLHASVDQWCVCLALL